MVQIDDIIKRSRYINLTNHQQEYNRFHTKSKTLLESTTYRFNDKKFLLQHWESLHEDQTECFKLAVDILDEAYDADNIRDFNYTKSYIINEIAPTVRDAKQTAKYLKYKTTRMQNRITERVKKNVDQIKDTTKQVTNNVKKNASDTVSTLKNNVNKSLGKDTNKDKKIKEQELHEAYIQIMDILDKYYHCDRILENAYTVQKRFNIMNIVESTNIDNRYELEALVDSICEYVNTYDADFKTRFNTTLETCFYFLSRNDRNFNKQLVLEEVVNNYISKDFPESKLYEMRSIIDESAVFDNLDKKSVEFIYNSPFKYVTEIANPFLKSNNEKIFNLGKSISKVSDDMTDRDVKAIFSALRTLFTISGGEVLAECINDVKVLIKDMKNQYSGDDFGQLCAAEVERVSKKRDNKSPEGYMAQANYIKILNKYASSSSKNEAELLIGLDFYNEDFVSSVKKNAKEIVDDFKLRKTKKTLDIRTCVSKMFTKSPNEIIDGTPNFLSWIRLTYVIGATAIHPILGAATLLVDQFIAMKLKRRDVSKMITVYKNEKKAVAEKIKKVDEKDRQNLKEYDKYLDNAIAKMTEYEDSLFSEYEKDTRDNKEKYDRDAELKSITGEDDDSDDDDDWDDDDFDLEATSFEKTFENSNGFSKQYFTSNIRKCIDYIDEDTIDIITEIACNHPSIISTSGLYSLFKEQLASLSDKYCGTKKWVRMACLTSNLRKLDPESSEYMVTSDDETSDVFDVINGLEDLFAEVSINKSLGYTNESMSTMVKSIANKLRNTIQKAKDVDKEVSRKIDSSVNMFISGMQRAATNDNREAIIRGSIIPSASKVVKTAIVDGAVAMVNPAIAIILALGQFAVSKKMQKKERQLVLDEIDIELEMCKRYMRQAEDQNDLDAQKQLLRIQRNLERQKQRIQYNMKVTWNQDVPNIRKDDDD